MGTVHEGLFNPQNFSPSQAEEFSALKDLQLKVELAWVAKELFSKFRLIRGKPGEPRRLKPMIEVARKLKRHLETLLTYLKHPITNAVTEGLNSKIQGIKSAALGFRNFKNYRTRLLFFRGKLDLYPLSLPKER